MPRARESRSSARFMRPRLGTGKDNIATAVGRPATVSLINGTFGWREIPRQSHSFAFIVRPPVTRFKSSESIIDHYLLIVRRNLSSEKNFVPCDFSFSFDSIGSRCGVWFVWRLIKIGNATQICLIPKEKERKVSEQRLNERVNS